MLATIRTSDGYALIIDGASYQISESHPLFNELERAVLDGDTEFIKQNYRVEHKIQSLGFEVKNDHVYFDGEELHNVICDRIIELFKAGKSVDNLLKFLENLMKNPSKRSVDQLYTFMRHSNLPITDDGCLLAYKTLRADYTDKHTGRFDNSPGKVHEVTRNKVDDDFDKNCSYGFHVGGLGYSGPGGDFWSEGDKVVIVKVNPEHVVAVPKDYSCQKMRVCKYEVVCDYVAPLSPTEAKHSGWINPIGNVHIGQVTAIGKIVDFNTSTNMVNINGKWMNGWDLSDSLDSIASKMFYGGGEDDEDEYDEEDEDYDDEDSENHYRYGDAMC